MTVTSGPLPTFAPAQVLFQGAYDQDTGAFQSTPPPQNVTITNPGASTLNFTVVLRPTGCGSPGCSNAWFGFSPPSGTVAPGGTAVVTLSVLASCLSTPACLATIAPGQTSQVFVNFPALNYSYLLGANFLSSSFSSEATGPGGNNNPLFRSRRAPGPVAVAARRFSCTPSVLQGVFTSLPPAFPD